MWLFCGPGWYSDQQTTGTQINTTSRRKAFAGLDPVPESRKIKWVDYSLRPSLKTIFSRSIRFALLSGICRDDYA
jgi:hypothetical protein